MNHEIWREILFRSYFKRKQRKLHNVNHNDMKLGYVDKIIGR